MARWLSFGAIALAMSALFGVQVRPTMAETAQLMVGASGKMQATMLAPDGAGPYPGILLLHTSGGLEQADLAYAQRLVGENYVVLVPAFMMAYGLNARSRQETFTSDANPIFADFLAALDTLRRNPKVAGSKLGAIGFSNGGYFAAWLAGAGKVDAAVGYYGAYSGAGSDKSLNRFRSTFTKGSAPLLILHGSEDETVPVGAAKHLASIVVAAGSPSELHIYDGAGHQFERDSSPPNNAAAADAWTRTLAFFAKYLKGR